MCRFRLPQSVLALFLFITLIQALRVTENSDCEALCTDASADSDSTKINSTDIACEDNSFTKTGKGIKYKNCLDCLQNSNATHGEESDVFSFLYNVRYAFDVCIFTYPDAPSSGTVNSPCNIDGACAPLGKALKTSLVNMTLDNQFDYCNASNSAIEGEGYDACITCLEATTSQTYFSNFLVALRAGCEQRPHVGDLIGLNGTIFTSSLVNITNTTTSSKLPGDGGAPVGAMTTGTIVGIAVGCILALISILGLLFIYCRKQRREGMKIDSPPPDDAPMNQHGIRKGPMFASQAQGSWPSYNNAAALAHNRSISNGQFYDKLEAERKQPSNYYQVPHTKSHAPGSTIPAHHAYIPQVTSRTHKSSLSAPSIPMNNMPNSYRLQPYIPAAATSRADPNFFSSNFVAHGTGLEINDSQLPPPPPPPPPPLVAPKVPALSLPSLAKFKLPKKYTPPNVLGQNGASERVVEKDEPDHCELNISKPVAISEPRFHDKPLQGGQVLTTEAPAYFSKYLATGKSKSPMKSGNSSNSKILW